MADSTQKIAIELKAVDMASSVVKNIGKATGHLLKTIDKITMSFGGIVNRYGGLGAALSLGASVNSAKKYFDQIERIKNVAGGTANEIAGVRHAMVKAGVSAADMESSYVLLAKKGGEMRANMAGTNQLARRMGVDFRKGPVEALVKMSKHVQSGKIGYKELNKLGGEGMLRMRKFLQQGPQVVRQQFAAAQKKMGHVNEQTMAQYAEFKTGVGKISQAWNRMVVIVGAKLLPILTKLMDGVASRIDSWAEGAAKFGDFLVKHMDAVVALAKIFGKIMMANYVLMKLTGQGMSGHMGGMVARAKKSGGGGKFALAEAVSRGGLRGRAAGGISNMMAKGGKMGRVGAILGRFFTGMMALRPIIMVLLKLSLVGAVITAIVHGIQMAVKSMSGVGKKISKLFKGIWADIRSIGSQLAEAFGEGSALGEFLKWVGTIFVKIFVKVMEIVKGLTGMINTVIYMIKNRVGWDTARNKLAQGEAIKNRTSFTLESIESWAAAIDKAGGKVNKQNIANFKELRMQFKTRDAGGWDAFVKHKGYEKLAKAAGKDKEGVGGERPSYYQDFRGSRFDITQKFAEGFDPDRIAVAFANDLSNFGEQKVQSALLSPFTVR